MKKFVVKSIIGVMFFLVAMILLETLVIPYAANNQYKYKYDYVTKHKDEITILVMGNSYFENGMNPHLIGESVFNMAVAGRWIYYDKELVKHLVPMMPNLRIVMFPMGYKMLFESSSHYSEDIYMDFVHEKFMHVWYDIFPDNIIRWSALSQGRNSLSTIFRNTSDVKGYNAKQGHISDNWQSHNNIKPEIICGIHTDAIVAEYTTYMQEMADVCAKHNVRFIVITPPCYDSFLINTRSEGIDMMHNIIEEVRINYSIEYIDYLQDGDFRADSIYYDSSHLNSTGADLFTLRVKKDFGL